MDSPEAQKVARAMLRCVSTACCSQVLPTPPTLRADAVQRAGLAARESISNQGTKIFTLATLLKIVDGVWYLRRSQNCRLLVFASWKIGMSTYIQEHDGWTIHSLSPKAHPLKEELTQLG